jgi:hypothetical protein
LLKRSYALSLCIVLGFARSALGAQQPDPQAPPAPVTVEVDVTGTREGIADQQIREQEQQRLFGIFPNFRVSYRPDAVSLNARQKFHLAWKSVSDPVRFASTGVTAGILHARGDFPGFGSGFEGYAKRYTALYMTSFTATMISTAAVPSLLRQDPRYFYKGTGSGWSRAGYATSRAVVRKGDNGRWQPDYSRIIGSLTSGALSNLYFPEEDRRSARLTIQNAALVLGGAAAGNLLQEFLYKRLTTHSNH